MDSPSLKQTDCKVMNIFQNGKYLVAYVLDIHTYEELVRNPHIYDKLLPYYHRYEELVHNRQICQ